MNKIATSTLCKLLISILLCVSWNNAHAEQTESAELVERTVAKVQKVVEEKSGNTPPEKLDTILKDLITPVFDFEEMSKRCLGTNWKTASPDQQKEFQKLFSNLLAKNYIKQIREKAKGSKFKILGAQEASEKATVQTMVTTDAGDLKIDYRLYNKPGNWKIYDVIIENIGLVSNYRSEFSDIVSKEGVSGLIEKLRNK